MGKLKLIAWVWLALLIGGQVAAQPGSVETDLKPVIDKLARTATSQQFSQIIGAARASPRLAAQLTRLVAAGKLTEIRIVSARNSSKPFDAWVDGSTILVTADLLKRLLDNKETPIHEHAQFLPNNTVYLLGHLAYHLAAGAPDPLKSRRMDDYVNKMLEIEAGAYIQGFNVVIDAAVQSNGGRVLTERQQLPLLLNSRYRKAIGKTRLSSDGTIELSAQNIAAVVASLKESPMADIE